MSAAANRRPVRHRPGEKTLTPKVENLNVGDAPSPAKSRTTKPRESGSPRARAGSEEQPRYRQQMRLEARLWPEQLPALSALRREISQARTERGERITDNTLIRIAVDLLLAHADQLQGNTEEELRASVLPDNGST
jgi:hypothetical protein